jgi:uncharacterized iron-regulated membrane protein
MPTARTWLTLHAWLGLQLGVLLFIICFTGTLAVFSHELDHLAQPQSWTKARPVQWQNVVDKAREYLNDSSLSYAEAPEGFRTAVRMHYRTSDGQRRILLQEPASGQVLSDGGWLTLQRFLRNFHMMLFDVEVGFYIVLLTAVPLCLLLLTPMLFYRRWWKNLFAIRADKGPRPFWSDWHRSFGVVSLPVTLIILLTSLWYLAEHLADTTDNYIADNPYTAPHAGTQRMTDSYDAMLRQATFSPAAIHQIHFPAVAGQPVAVTYGRQFWLRARANVVYFDPGTQLVADTVKAEQLPLLYYWLHMADRLHFGNFAGMPSQIIWGVSGLALTLCVLIGSRLAALRLFTRGSTPSATFFVTQLVLVCFIVAMAWQDIRLLASDTQGDWLGMFLGYPLAGWLIATVCCFIVAGLLWMLLPLVKFTSANKAD